MMSGPGEAVGVLREIYEGCCDNHLGGRALARKAILAGYFWPTLNRDATQMVKAYRSCQVYNGRSERPTELMRASVASCPFD